MSVEDSVGFWGYLAIRVGLHMAVAMVGALLLAIPTLLFIEEGLTPLIALLCAIGSNLVFITSLVVVQFVIEQILGGGDGGGGGVHAGTVDGV